MAHPSSVPLLVLLASFLLLQMQLVVGSSDVSPLLSGNWTAFPGKSLSPAPPSAHLAPDGVQVIVQLDGVTLRRNVTGLMPGGTYILSLRTIANTSASVNMAIAADSTAVITSVVPGTNTRTGAFVAAMDNETLSIALFTVGSAARVYLDNVTISPAADNQTIDARHMGHVDYVVPPFDAVTHAAPPRCPLNTRTCYNANGTQITCCSSTCGANNDPIATCHVANATVPKLPGKVAVPAGATCPPSAPNPCYNFNGQSMACCPGACGANGGAIATCAGDADVTPAPTRSSSSSSPSSSSPSTTGAPGTCPPQAPNPCYNYDGQSMACCPGACGPNGGSLAACEGGATAPAAPASTTSSPTLPPATPSTTAAPASPPKPPANPSPTNPPATPSPTTPTVTPSPTKPPATSSPSNLPATPTTTTAPATPALTTPAPTTPTPTTAPATLAPTVVPVAPALGAPTSSTILPTAPSGYRWVVNPALTDEFNGDGLDTSKWRATHPYWSGRLPSQFDPANVAVGAGVARLTSTTTVSSFNQVNDPYNDPWISSAVISSKAAIAGFGYYECRFKASNMQMTSSFWFQSQHTEIDVIETVGIASNYRSRSMSINTHYYPDSISPSQPDSAVGYRYRLPTGTLTSGDFHTYGVWWKDANTLLFYFDSQLAWQTSPPGPFSEQSYLFFDTEVFSSEGLPAVADLKDPNKNAFIVDYVRAFQLQLT